MISPEGAGSLGGPSCPHPSAGTLGRPIPGEAGCWALGAQPAASQPFAHRAGAALPARSAQKVCRELWPAVPSSLSGPAGHPAAGQVVRALLRPYLWWGGCSLGTRMLGGLSRSLLFPSLLLRRSWVAVALQGPYIPAGLAVTFLAAFLLRKSISLAEGRGAVGRGRGLPGKGCE